MVAGDTASSQEVEVVLVMVVVMTKASAHQDAYQVMLPTTTSRPMMSMTGAAVNETLKTPARVEHRRTSQSVSQPVTTQQAQLSLC